MRTVNVHQAKTQLSQLLDAAHGGETIVLAKAGKPWARLMPLDGEAGWRQPGVLRDRMPLPPPDVLLEPLSEAELDAFEGALFPQL
ncbi:type II toxin-antitoxin system Phd/YefM family antitoxin [Cyanobium sp. ATX 6F1]|uniref:type II toxin-antitoxin system Phd/YefM family antitoxin n=1 Tax=unclassified Cyanobium TaxID=2627006 RepID=UPI0020CDD19C|nr:type II toxin-antitoxin system prevent-host-death family antitoxin [Cyanobium sp. ATX 6F1]MCP9915815.1 type II toxin-antitoxin system prevent-host-death family antitoxin [Cyanobium sp. ATX 6F1]